MRPEEITWGDVALAIFALVSIFGGVGVIIFAAIQWLPIWLTLVCLALIFVGWRIADGYSEIEFVEQEDKENIK